MENNGLINDKIYCMRCNTETNNSYVANHCEQGTDYETGISYIDNYYITKCLGCDTIAFYQEYGDSEMIEWNEYDEQVNYTHQYRYPNKPSNINESVNLLREIREFEAVPDEINDLYSEVVASYNTRHYLLSAVGLRMIVEGICKELEVKEGVIFDANGKEKLDKDNNKIMRNNLEGKINGLQTLGVTVKAQTDILHQVRLLGNLSAHELKVPRRRTVELGLDIIENILYNIFDLKKIQIV